MRNKLKNQSAIVKDSNQFTNQQPADYKYSPSPNYKYNDESERKMDESPIQSFNKFDKISEQQNRPSDLNMSAKKRANLRKQKAILDDNKKDLIYMELLTGVQQSQRSEDEEQQLKYNQDFSRNNGKQITPMKVKTSDGNYYDSLGKSKGAELDMDDLKSNSPQTIDQRKEFKEQAFFQTSGGKQPSPISKRVAFQNQDEGLTPKISKQLDGQQELYRQELDILKQNIYKCSQQDRSIQQNYEEKEEKLWQSFSQSPSPYKQREQESPLIKMERVQEPAARQDFYQDNSAQKLRSPPNQPENVLQNDMYLMMLKSPQTNLKASGANFDESSGIMTYSKNLEYSQMSYPLKSSIANSQVKPNKYEIQNITERQSEESKIPIEDEIEKLRRENERLKQNLSNMIDQRQKGVSYNEKSSVHYYDKSSPSIATNPYQRNLYNSAKKGGNIADDKNMMSDNSNFNQAALSPIQNSQYYQHYSQTIDYQQPNSMINDDNEYNSQIRQQQEEEEGSPYRKLSYHEQMKKFRSERQKEEQEIQEVKEQREQFKANVLRYREKKTSEKKKPKKNMNSHRSHHYETQLSYNQYPASVQNVDTQSNHDSYVTPSKRLQMSEKQGTTYRSSQMCTYDATSMEMNFNADFLKKISKYDLDRASVDFHRLLKNKEKERTEHVKIKKEVQDQEIEYRKCQDVASTLGKINTLQYIKEQQDRERKEFLRKQQDAFRKAIEERQQIDKNQQYLSPNGKSNSRSASKVMSGQKSAAKDLQKENKGWSNEIEVSGSKYEKQEQQNHTPMQRIRNNEAK